jgi:hypothetical protein
MRRIKTRFFVALSLLGMAACSSASVTLVQPRTGARIECGASGWGIMYGAAAGIVDECVRSHAPDGYVPVEKLTPEERADLERRGVLTPTVEQRPSMY